MASLALAMLTMCAPAHADVGEKIILRCTHNESISGFSQADYRKALKDLNADTEEYSGCEATIRQAALAAAAGGAGGGVAGGPGAPAAVPLPATSAEQQAITHAQKAGSQSVRLSGGAPVRPGVVHVSISSALSSLPSPLLATLAFLLACLLLIAGGAARNRIRARRAD